MLEVYTWEPNANSGKPLLCLHENRVPFTHHYIDMAEGRSGKATAGEMLIISTMGPELGC